MLKFRQWLQERKKAHYSGDEHDSENFPQVAGRYKDLRNSSRETLQKLAVKRGVDSTESDTQLTSDILRKELGDARVDGYYNRSNENNVYRARMRQKAKNSAKASYQKEKEK